MPAITLKNIPDSLYAQLKEAASLHRRSLNSEILHCVDEALNTHKVDVPEHLDVARRLRAKTAKFRLTAKILNDAKHQGRP
jgi:antitoxin FitA